MRSGDSVNMMIHTDGNTSRRNQPLTVIPRQSHSTSSALMSMRNSKRKMAMKAIKARRPREILDRVPTMISIRTEEGVADTNRRLSDYVGSVIIIDLRDGSYLDYIHPDATTL